MRTARLSRPQAEAALMYDAVHVLAHALQQVDKSTRLRLVNLTCEGDQAWAFGSSLYNYLNLVSRFKLRTITVHLNTYQCIQFAPKLVLQI